MPMILQFITAKNSMNKNTQKKNLQKNLQKKLLKKLPQKISKNLRRKFSHLFLNFFSSLMDNFMLLGYGILDVESTRECNGDCNSGSAACNPSGLQSRFRSCPFNLKKCFILKGYIKTRPLEGPLFLHSKNSLTPATHRGSLTGVRDCSPPRGRCFFSFFSFFFLKKRKTLGNKKNKKKFS